jgi:hypothetical protein
MWDAVMGLPGAVLRNETWIEDGIIRVGEYKLITSNCGGRGLVGTGGGWVVPATNASKRYPDEGKPEGPIDEFLQKGCNESMPCLYHVGGGGSPYANDAIEATNLAQAEPAIVAAMKSRLAEYEATKWTGFVQMPDDGGACERASRQGWVLGPWLQ